MAFSMLRKSVLEIFGAVAAEAAMAFRHSALVARRRGTGDARLKTQDYFLVFSAGFGV
jgi:hypothetical protein